MKRGIKIALPILLVIAMVLTAVFVFTATAAATTEASLTTQTVTKDATWGYHKSYVSNGTASGTLRNMITAAALGEDGTELIHTIKLNGDLTLDRALEIEVNAYTEVVIDLNGYTLTTATDADAIVVSGDAGIVRILGGNRADGTFGEIVYAQSAGAILNVAEGSGVRANVRNVNLDMSGVSDGAAAFVAEGGELTLNVVNVDFAPSGAINASLANANGALLEMKKVNINGANDSGAELTAVSASGSRVYIQDGVFNTAYGVVTDATKSDIILVDTAITANTPVSVASAETTVYVLGGRIETTGEKLISGSFTAANVVFYYGSGDMKVVGEDPTAYSVQEECEFVAGEDGVWVMNCTNTSKAVMLTKATVGSAPTVSYPDTLAKAFETPVASTATNVNIVTLIADASISKFSTASYDEYYNLVFDLNGHKATLTDKAGWNYDVYGFVNIHFDGKASDGTVGCLSVDSEHVMLFRTRIKSGYTGANMYTLISLTDMEVRLTRSDAFSNPLFCIQQGEFLTSGITVRYTGENASADASGTLMIYHIGSTTLPGTARGYINNSKVLNDSLNENAHIVALYTPEEKKVGGGKIWANALTVKGAYSAAQATASSYITITNSEIETTSTPYTGAGTIKVVGTDTTVLTGVISSGGAPEFGAGCNIYTGNAELSGEFTSPSGFGVVKVAKGEYAVMEGLKSASITMPAIFADGMVLQRNKTINVFGYCNEEGAVVEVRFGGATAYGTVINGRWDVSLPPMEAAWNQTLEIVQLGAAYNLKTIKNINVGEVWVVSGQSNGDLKTFYMEDLKEYFDLNETLKNVRVYSSSTTYKLLPQTIGSGKWSEATASLISNKSNSITAIGYTMAAKLSQELGDDVPIAVMHMAQGSCKVKTWVDYKRLQEIAPSATREYDYWVEQGTLPYKAYSTQAVGTVMYNNVIAPVYGYEIAGVLWYQGEGDTGGGYFGCNKTTVSMGSDGKTKVTIPDFKIAGEAEEADNCYTEFFYAVEDSFREAFGNDPELPFYVMQLSPFVSSSYEASNVYNFKMEQYEMCKNEPNTYLVSLATDGAIIGGAFFDGNLDPNMGSASVGSQGFIHPIRKSTIGIRAADMILANMFGFHKDEVYTYPVPQSATLKNGVITIEFDTELQYFYGNSVMGFEVYNGTSWVKLSGSISGNKILLDASGVTTPTKLRYGCGNMLMELADGTIVEITGASGQKANHTTDQTGKTVTITYNDVEYVIHGDTGDMIRSLDYGNITNASGVPLVIFGMEIVTE